MYVAQNVPPKYLFVNEGIALEMLLPKLYEEAELDIPQKGDADFGEFLEFRKLLLYNFKHRDVTPHALEQMISAFLLAKKSAFRQLDA
jgi:hypothetical protein